MAKPIFGRPDCQFAAAVLLCLCTSMAMAGSNGDFPLCWRDRIYVWHYNPQHQPIWLGLEEALDLVRKAAAGWEPCGVTLHYAGLTDRPPGIMDGENVVGWSEYGHAHSAWTSWR